MKRSMIGLLVGITGLMIGQTGCNNSQETTAPPPQKNGVPTEAQQRMQQMSPEMRAKMQAQMDQMKQNSGAPPSAPKSGQ